MCRFLKSLLLAGLVCFLVACSHGQIGQVSPSEIRSQSLDRATTDQATTPCRLVSHALGQTCVPLHPQRIATLTDVDFVNVLLLGIRPIATVFYTNPSDVPFYLQGKLDQVQVLGTNAQPSIERMLQIKPDLVLGIEHTVLPISTLLSRIAPTVAGSWQGTSSWRDYFNFVAEVLDKKAEAQAAWAHYDQRIRELQVALGIDKTGDRIGSEKREPLKIEPLKISVFHICCGALHVDTKNSFNGSILADVGFRRPQSQDVIVEGGLEFISEEMIPEIDADVIFIPTDPKDRDSSQRLAQLMQKSLWKRLKAVKQNRVYFVDYHIWRSANLFAAEGVIDDLFKYLVNSSAN